MLYLYRELEFKYKSLEETSVDLEENLRSLEQSIFGKNKKVGGIKSALSRVKKSNTAVLPNDVSNANLGTEVIVNSIQFNLFHSYNHINIHNIRARSQNHK